MITLGPSYTACGTTLTNGHQQTMYMLRNTDINDDGKYVKTTSDLHARTSNVSYSQLIC